ncbi:MAG: hypothetical protein ACD_59C00075G0001 [uncultured bacterium]|nr:MAG: hypothetical protein ACD_59C00075G0001 [uncultured bacterium]
MPNQQKLQFNDKKIIPKDDFASSCEPLSELLDSVHHIEGFPLAKDEDILALSDPPYYTACPNPYINDFIEKFGKIYDAETDDYERTPFVGDVSEGKNDPIYNAHSYHTKVPHKAIMKYIEHYTDEGDIVFDGFCGSGMTGVAAQMLNRKAILSDLSPVATFISYNYNTPVDVEEFEIEVKHILAEVEKECSWMYETLHFDEHIKKEVKGKINYTVWSDVLVCPYCSNDYIFWEAAVDEKKGEVKDIYKCPNCSAQIKKADCKRATASFYDKAINSEITQAKQIPVFINYSYFDSKKHTIKRAEKKPDKFDLDLIKKIDESVIPYWFPTNRMPEGDEARRNDKMGITHVYHFYTKRNLWALSKIYSCIVNKSPIRDKNYLLVFFTSLYSRTHKMNRYMPNHFRHVGPLSGTLYISTLPVEINCIDIASDKFNSQKKIKNYKKSKCLITIQALNNLNNFISNSVDYIFTDPPFGDNLMYSELSYSWEAWLKVFTNNKSEAIMNDTQNKKLSDYKELMTACFKEYYRVLKPNRWITVEFHNSKASVWQAIQDAITKAGFVIAQVAVIDKQKGTTKQLSYAGAVKNDLVINAYKPKKDFEENFLKNAGKDLEKEFVGEHLKKLPIEPNVERTEQMLYSKLIVQYIHKGFEIRFDARRFYALLRDNFKLIDGYWFNDNQVLKYDAWKKKQGLNFIKEIKAGQTIMFVNDEKSALIWLYNFLEMPNTFSEVFTAYSKATSNIEDEIPELKLLLDSNFIFEDNKYRRPHNEKEKENVELHRENELLKAFEKIFVEAKTATKKIKSVRKEAIMAGFTKAYQEKHYSDILTVAKKLDNSIIDNDSYISDFVDIAKLKVNEENLL